MVMNGCTFMRIMGAYTDHMGHTVRDESAIEHIRSLPGSALFDPITKKKVIRQVRMFFERYPAQYLSTHKFANIMSPGKIRDAAGVQACTSNVIVMPEIDIVPVILSHYRDLILLSGIIIAAAMIKLIIEVRVPHDKTSIRRVGAKKLKHNSLRALEKRQVVSA
jgi:hypothetical protein